MKSGSLMVVHPISTVNRCRRVPIDRPDLAVERMTGRCNRTARAGGYDLAGPVMRRDAASGSFVAEDLWLIVRVETECLEQRSMSNLADALERLLGVRYVIKFA